MRWCHETDEVQILFCLSLICEHILVKTLYLDPWSLLLNISWIYPQVFVLPLYLDLKAYLCNTTLPGFVSISELRYLEDHFLHIVTVWAHLEFTNLKRHLLRMCFAISHSLYSIELWQYKNVWRFLYYYFLQEN